MGGGAHTIYWTIATISRAAQSTAANLSSQCTSRGFCTSTRESSEHASGSGTLHDLAASHLGCGRWRACDCMQSAGVTLTRGFNPVTVTLYCEISWETTCRSCCSSTRRRPIEFRAELHSACVLA